MPYEITFSFAENWCVYKDKASPEQFDAFLKDLQTWVVTEKIKDKCILDTGCDSRVHSFDFLRLVTKELTSFGFDAHSVNSDPRVLE